MSLEKEYFLRSRFISCLQRLQPDAKPLFGKMSVQQMVEHFVQDALPVARGKRVFPDILTPVDKLQKLRAYMLSDQPFREGTRNPLMGEKPAPLLYHTLQVAINELQVEMIEFFRFFEKNPSITTRNPFFGDLDFEQNVHLLYKHALHHLRQFGMSSPF